MPVDYEAEFIKGGHRRCERLFGKKTDLNRKWWAQLGGLEALQAKRRAYLASLKK